MSEIIGDTLKRNWTLFTDLLSDRGRKTDFDDIIIEAPIEEAKRIFWEKFGFMADKISCECCGEDFDISEIADISAYQGKSGVLIVERIG